MSNPTTKALKSIVILMMPLLIIITSVRVLTTDQYLAFEYGKARFPPDLLGFTSGQRLKLASTNIHYVLSHLPRESLLNQRWNGAPIYNSREVSHMADVRAVFQSIFRVRQAAFILLFSTGFILWQKRAKHALASAIQWSGLWTAGVLTSIALLAAFAWQFWFSTFHLFFFEPGSWQFSYSDTLIRLFPVEFWFDATLTISLLSMIGGLLTAFIGRQWRIAIEKIP